MGVRNSRYEVQAALSANGGVLRRRDRADLVNQIEWLVDRGELQRILPGIYVEPTRARDFEVRALSISRWDADVVLLGRAAAKATFWPQLGVSAIEVSAPRKRLDHREFRLSQRRIPPELITEVQGIRVTSPALTALDLSVTLGGDAIDTVLRTRAATLDQMHEALVLTPSRRGNADRRMLLLDSRGKPWSEAERDLHRLLREAGIDGWEGNWGFELLSGVYWIDIAFEKLKLAIEVDGWEFHKTPEAFESDRWRQNDLVLAGWRVLRFTAKMIRDHPQIVLRVIERALAQGSR